MLKFRSICTTLIGGKVYNINGKTIREEKLISEGAYSFVYMAKDLNTNRAYTIKKTICQDKEKIDMANKEINILKSLPPHKNIVQYYGSTIISENNYKIVIMLMEYCERGNLLNIFQKNKDKIKEIHIVNILKDIITGLCFLHNQEIPIIHRDIKLENILCDKNGVYKICDFCSHSISNSFFPNDLSKSELSNLKEEIERDTTLIYRPPELIDLYSNFEISWKIDIWMVGCILYLLLFKIHPFQNNNFLSIINASFTIPYCTKYSKKIISILLMTLNKNPQKRIDTSTLLFILENYADLKKWFVHIPADIKKRVNQIFEKMNELNMNNKHTDLIEVSHEKLIDVKISSQKYETNLPKSNNNFLKFFTTSNLSGDIFKKKIEKEETKKEIKQVGNKQVSETEKEPKDKLENNPDGNKLQNDKDSDVLNINRNNEHDKNAITCSNEYYNLSLFYDPWNNNTKDNHFFGDDDYNVNKSSFIFNNDLFDNYELCTNNNTEKSTHHVKNNCMDINNNIFSNKNYDEHVDKKEKNISYDYNVKSHPIYSSYKNEKRCNLNDIKQNNSSKYIMSDKNDKFSELLDEFQKCTIK
ncbi:NAK protein kinase [Plasmodium falciparum CAMP/Malaysia]|uniref:non-specific serine/threonine protein kinase n=1 Tax=Plasmodium falciparum (isolate Camp / Malaysia) TaxID=5835 RepID=A0A024X5B0_PLAFC|nr:NAK protein kinase [Plasmodium falciparum CAMP/Malaysia]